MTVKRKKLFGSWSLPDCIEESDPGFWLDLLWDFVLTPLTAKTSQFMGFLNKAGREDKRTLFYLLFI
jgi:hypothetical protein